MKTKCKRCCRIDRIYAKGLCTNCYNQQFIGNREKTRQTVNQFNKEKIIADTLTEMRILWNKHNFKTFHKFRIDMRIDGEKFILQDKNDFKLLIRAFQFVKDMKKKPNVRFILKPR